MPKHGFLTPKAIANRIKAKGLQKLRWYCQMCQKQCRDQNGFKCHLMSEGHQRQMTIFTSNSSKFIDEFSQQFEDEFLKLLSRRYGERRVPANEVYNEFIKDRHHVHMNATMWTTLSNFVQYLGRASKCVVEETEKGWHIQWINRDPELLAKQEQLGQRQKAEEDEMERQRRILERQVRIAHETAPEAVRHVPAATELQRSEEEERLAFAIAPRAQEASGDAAATAAAAAPALPSKLQSVFGDEPAAAPAAPAAPADTRKRPRSALDAIMEEEERRKRQAQERLQQLRERDSRYGPAGAAAADGAAQDAWLLEGIVVKVMNSKLGEGRYYKQKGLVRRVREEYLGDVKLLDSGETLRIDQDELETVIPQQGGAVVMLRGPHRGCRGTLKGLDVPNYCADIALEDGRLLRAVAYEDFSKAAE